MACGVFWLCVIGGDPRFGDYWRLLYERTKRRGVTPDSAKALVRSRATVIGALMLERGEADAMICGGAESAITPMSVAGFASMRALSTRNDDPKHASRPFDLTRDGFVIGEGAGILILEELEFAKARGANILAESRG